MSPFSDLKNGERPSLARILDGNRPLVMGVLNVTPDSFSDGGRFFQPDAALAQAHAMISDGADMIDIGAESTRPYGGATPVSAEDELKRLEPILSELIALECPISVDTMKAVVAAAALEKGAALVNDVWGLQRDPDMARVIAEHGVPVVIMHNRDNVDPAIDIMRDIADFFSRSLDIATRAGIAKDAIVLDPGIGFGKTAEQSIMAIAKLDLLKDFQMPLLIGVSRKRFIASIVPSAPDQRLGGSIAANLLAVEKGAKIVRTHDVADTVQALRIAAAIRSAV